MKKFSTMKRLSTLALVFTALLTIFHNRSLGEPAATNSLGMTMVPIAAGSFEMGSPDGGWDERPVHRVTISRPFCIGATEVTNA